MSANVDLNNRPDYDTVLQDIADYILNFKIESTEALDTARNCLMDTLGCGLLALRFPECTKHLGPDAFHPVSHGSRGRKPSGLHFSTAGRPDPSAPSLAMPPMLPTRSAAFPIRRTPNRMGVLR